MNCPVCDLPLIILELNQIEIDYCTNCSGIWLDSGELNFLLNSNEKEELLNSFSIFKGKEKSIKCPVCFKQMEKILFNEKEEIILDKCPRHHGLWFNKGELQKVVEHNGLHKEIVFLLKEMFSNNLNN